MGAGSTLIEIQREEADLAWEVKVRPAAAFIRDVESVPNGTVVDAKIDD